MSHRSSLMVAAFGLFLCLLLVANPVFAQAMKMVAASILIPTDSDNQPLAGLKYGAPWSVEFTAIRLDLQAEPGSEKTTALWTVTGFSGRPRPERVQLVITIIDGAGKAITSAKKSIIVKMADTTPTFELKMKLKAKQWERAERVRIAANFFIAG